MENTVTLEKLHNVKQKPANIILKTTGNIFFALIIIISILISAYVIQNRRTNEDISIFDHRLFIVLSGSMSPEFNTGSAIVVRHVDPSEIKVDDIITFSGISQTGNTTTHRVIEVVNEPELSFRTKGDANDVADPNLVPQENVLGVVRFSVPLLGYLLNFAKSRTGGYFLIILPAMAIIIFEINKILRIAFNSKNKNKSEEKTETVFESEALMPVEQNEPEEERIMDESNNDINRWQIKLSQMENKINGVNNNGSNNSSNPTKLKQEEDEPRFSLIKELENELSQIKQRVGILKESLNTKGDDDYSETEIDSHVVNLLYEAHKESVKKIYDHKKMQKKVKEQMDKQVQNKKIEENEYDKMILKLKQELKIKLNAYEIIRGGY